MIIPLSTKNLIPFRKSSSEIRPSATQESALIGTQTHKLIENHLNGITQTDEVRLLSVAHFNNLLPFLQKINDIHGTELRLYSNEMKLAGTSDCIAKYDGELSIIDYKTKRSNQQEEWMTDHFIQGTAYSQMFKELSGIEVKQVVILVSSEKKQIKAIKADIYKRMKNAKFTENKEWGDIGIELVKLQTDGIIPDMGYAGKDGDYFSNLFNRWKRKYESVPI